MKIIQKVPGKVFFTELKTGDVFRIEKCGNIYIRILPLFRNKNFRVNSIKLQNGEFFYFEDTDAVERVNGYFKEL